MGRLVAGKWVAAVLLVVVVVGKWAEHASVSGQPVSLSARTLVELHQQPRKLLEDMDDDYHPDSEMGSSQPPLIQGDPKRLQIIIFF